MASHNHMDSLVVGSHKQSMPGLKLTTIDLIGGIYCHICHLTIKNKKEYDLHYMQHSTGDKDIIYNCVVCYKQFSGYPSFRGHCYLNHVNKDKFQCSHCQKSYSKLSVLQNHIKSVHELKCNSCDQIYPSRTELLVHQTIHKNVREKPPYECQSCTKIIESLDMCEEHLDDHTNISYPCPICDEIFMNRPDAVKHLTKHFGVEFSDSEFSDTNAKEDCSVNILGGILCCHCDELFKNRTEFDVHFKDEHIDMPITYCCNICGKSYDQYAPFGKHCYFHISKNRFHCEECGKSFPRLSMLVSHTEAFHSGGGGAGALDKPFCCVVCVHGFRSQRRLREHLRLVHRVHHFRCPERGCDCEFESSKDLILHQKHHKITSNWCRQCGLEFTNLASCEKHLDVHRRAVYTCPVCNKEYREKFILIKHIPQHFESILHMCKICGKVYNARNRLVQHAKTHSDLRSHKCSYCGKGFIKPYALQQHLNVHTGAKPYECTECPKSFGSQPNWLKHLSRIHNIDGKSVKKPRLDGMKQVKPVNDLKESIDTTSDDTVDVECVETDDSTIDSMEPGAENNDWQMINTHSLDDNVLELPNLLVENSATLVSESSDALFPREYGPDFVSSGAERSPGAQVIDLDEHILPHIDPLLTIKTADVQPQEPWDSHTWATPNPWEPQNPWQHQNPWESQNAWIPENAWGPAAPWEPPIITKVFDEADVNRLSILNTDIF